MCTDIELEKDSLIQQLSDASETETELVNHIEEINEYANSPEGKIDMVNTVADLILEENKLAEPALKLETDQIVSGNIPQKRCCC